MCLFFSSFLCIMNLYQNTVNRGFFFFFWMENLAFSRSKGAAWTSL